MKLKLNYKTPKGTRVEFSTPPKIDMAPGPCLEGVVWGCLAEGLTEEEMLAIISFAFEDLRGETG